MRGEQGGVPSLVAVQVSNGKLLYNVKIEENSMRSMILNERLGEEEGRDNSRDCD